MGRHDIAWPAARPVEEVSVFARWTSEGAAPKDRPPLFSGQDQSRGQGRRPSSRPVVSVTFPGCKGLLTFRCPAGLHLPRAPSRSGSRLGVDEFGGGVQGDTVSTGLSFWRR
jgi:hypothetical protein